LQPYLFAELDSKKEAARRSGHDVIDLGVGDPDMATPPCIVEAMHKAIRQRETHRYPSYKGSRLFREAIAEWYDHRFGVRLDPDTEVLALIGSKEGLGHLSWALLNPGDTALVPDPAYPVYEAGAVLAGGRPHLLPLYPERGYLADFDGIDQTKAEEARLLFLNYPNNPTAAVADLPFFEKAVAWAQSHGVMVCHDAAYTEIAFDGFLPPSFLSAEGAKETGIEIHSLSKTFNMTGWRIGFAVGHAGMIRALGEIKKNVDSGVFTAIQYAGVEALHRYDDLIGDVRETYRNRRDLMVEGLRSLGWNVESPRATFYLWTRIPTAESSTGFATKLLEQASVAAAPGVGFGANGEGFIRFSLTAPTARIEEAVHRIGKSGCF